MVVLNANVLMAAVSLMVMVCAEGERSVQRARDEMLSVVFRDERVELCRNLGDDVWPALAAVGVDNGRCRRRPVSELWDANGAEPSTSFSAREAAVLACRAAWAEMLPALVAKHACSERPGDGTPVPPMRGCDAACPQASASAAAVWAGRPLMRRLRIRRNRRTRARSPTTEVASTDARRTNFPVPRRHSRTPMIRTWMTSQRRG